MLCRDCFRAGERCWASDHRNCQLQDRVRWPLYAQIAFRMAIVRFTVAAARQGLQSRLHRLCSNCELENTEHAALPQKLGERSVQQTPIKAMPAGRSPRPRQPDDELPSLQHLRPSGKKERQTRAPEETGRAGRTTRESANRRSRTAPTVPEREGYAPNSRERADALWRLLSGLVEVASRPCTAAGYPPLPHQEAQP